MRILKKFLKVLGVLLVIVILLGAAAFIQVWYFKPFDINLFFGRTALQFALDSPETLSSLRILERFGIDGHNAKLNDASMAFADRLFTRLHEAHQTLLSYDDDDLSEADLMSKRIALTLMNLVIEAENYRFHNFPVNQVFGTQSSFPSFMESTHQVADVGDAEDYVTRLSLIDTKFDQIIEGLRHREKLGILPPQFLVTKVLEEMRNFVATKAEENILYTALDNKMTEAELDRDEHTQLLQAAKTEIEKTVYPAYGKLIAYFEALDPKVQGNYGVWKMPDGNNYYRLALKFFTTTDYTPDELHAFGLKEVTRLQAEMLTILDRVGKDTSVGFEAAMKVLSEDPRLFYPDNDKGREQILKDYQTIIDEISAGLKPAFNVIPKAKVNVQRVPEFKEKTSPGAYYNPASMDGSRPGVFYANLYDIKATPRYGMRTLTYHEAVPGHHFQIATQRELEDLPFFRRLVPFPAYSEGWAMYAERLAWELGFQKDPYDNLGRLQSELFRAVRLVVDTGIHAKRWSRERAVDYMIATTGFAESDVVAEIERYFVLPGQACSYKVGLRKILELREKAKAELAENFDIREFHDVVLLNGAVPLTILEDLVNDHIKEKRSSSQL